MHTDFFSINRKNPCFSEPWWLSWLTFQTLYIQTQGFEFWLFPIILTNIHNFQTVTLSRIFHQFFKKFLRFFLMKVFIYFLYIERAAIMCSFFLTSQLLHICFLTKIFYIVIKDSSFYYSFLRMSDESDELTTVNRALDNSRLAYVKLRQRAVVLKVARDQGWPVAKELSALQDQEEEPLLKKAIKNATRRFVVLAFYSLKNQYIL